jgi:zinc transporter ZupT
MLLFLSVLALFMGPLTHRLLQRQSGWLDLLDAFIFVTISGLVLFHILPEILHSGGLMVLVLMAIGLFAPGWIEKYFHRAARQTHQTTLFLAILGLVLHASIDGSVLLVESTDRTGWLLAIGVLLHRFPVGFTIWWLLRPQYGGVLPVLLLACFLSGLMHYFKPRFAVLSKQGSHSFFKDSLKGVIYGLPSPVCSTGVCKVHQQLLQQGANQTFATAF